MKHILIAAALVGVFAAGAAAQQIIGFGSLTHHEVTAPSPCGSWYPWQTEQVTPFVKNGDIWLMTRCTDGRLFFSQFPVAAAPLTVQ